MVLAGGAGLQQKDPSPPRFIDEKAEAQGEQAFTQTR